MSDNFAWELHRLAVAYPYQESQARDLPTAEIRAEEIYDGVRRIRLQRRTRRPKRPDWRTLLKRPRRAESRPGEWLEGFDAHLRRGGLGFISEIFDGNSPHTHRGCIAQAWSVAEVLRAKLLVEKYAQDKT